MGNGQRSLPSFVQSQGRPPLVAFLGRTSRMFFARLSLAVFVFWHFSAASSPTGSDDIHAWAEKTLDILTRHCDFNTRKCGEDLTGDPDVLALRCDGCMRQKRAAKHLLQLDVALSPKANTNPYLSPDMPADWKDYLPKDELPADGAMRNPDAVLTSSLTGDKAADNTLGPVTEGDLIKVDFTMADADQESINRMLMWQNKQVPFLIAENITDNLIRNMILEAIISMSNASCVSFVQGNVADIVDHHIVFVLSNRYGSTVGRGEGQVVQVADLPVTDASKGEILHLLMHVLGFGHEHTRPDRDEHLFVNMANVQPEHVRDLSSDTKGRYAFMDLPYDYDSITHYGFKIFARSSDYPTLIPKVKGQRIGQRDHLSATDILKINRLYNCDAETFTTTVASSTEIFPSTDIHDREVVEDWKGNWAFACDFPENDLKSIQVSGEECGGKCESTIGCTHFTWTPFNGGTCWLKKGSVSKSQALLVKNADPGMVCGIRSSIFFAPGTSTEKPSSKPSNVVWTGNWAFGCDFDGNDIVHARIRGEDCSGRCSVTPGCTHFTWNTFGGGTCWMKKGPVSKDDAVSKNGDLSFVCGVVDEISGGDDVTSSSTQVPAGKPQPPDDSSDSRVQIGTPVPVVVSAAAPSQKRDSTPPVPLIPSCPACVCQCPLPVCPVADPVLPDSPDVVVQPAPTPLPPVLALAVTPVPFVVSSGTQSVSPANTRPDYASFDPIAWQKTRTRSPVDALMQQMVQGAFQNSNLGYLFNKGGETSGVSRQPGARSALADQTANPFGAAGNIYGGYPYAFAG